jgi:hypothetical protein
MRESIPQNRISKLIQRPPEVTAHRRHNIIKSIIKISGLQWGKGSTVFLITGNIKQNIPNINNTYFQN